MSKKNEIKAINTLKDKIYYIRGKYIMIDSDLAEIYGYSTKDFNRQVKNNIDKFIDNYISIKTLILLKSIKGIDIKIFSNNIHKDLPPRRV